MQGDALQAAEVVAVFQRDSDALRARRHPRRAFDELDRRIDLAHLPEIHLRRAVGVDQAVGAVETVGIVELVGVAPGVPGRLAGIGRRCAPAQQALVVEVPDRAAREHRVRLQDRPLVLDAVAGQAQPVRVLGQDGRARELGSVAGEGGVARVVRRVQVHERRDLLVVFGEIAADLGQRDRPGGIELFDQPAGVELEVVVRILVADAPDNHGRMILVAHDGRAGAGQDVVAVGGIVEVFFAVSDGYLVHHIKAEFVAEFEQARVGRVVRRAHVVDVRLLHQRQVLAHLRLGYGAAGDGIEIVMIDAAQLDRLAVDQQLLADDPDFAQADALLDGLDGFALLLHVEHQAVERWCFCGPQLWLGDAQCCAQTDETVVARLCGHSRGQIRRQARRPVSGNTRGDILQHLPRNAFALGIEQLRVYGRAGRAQLYIKREPSVAALQDGADGQVLHVYGRQRNQGHIAINPRQRPVVVEVEFVAERLGGDAYSHRIPFLQQIGNIEGMAVERAGRRRTSQLAVDPHLVAEGHAVEAQERAPALPVFRHRERAAIQAQAILEIVAIRRLGMAVQFPVGRHRDGLPARDVETGRGELRIGAGVQAGQVFERPVAVERLRPGRIFGRNNISGVGLAEQAQDEQPTC